MSYQGNETDLFNIWLLESLAYQLSQQFVSLNDNAEVSCCACMFRLISVWSYLVNLLPEVNNDNKLSNWTVLSNLITISYNGKQTEVDFLESLIEEVELQKSKLGINDDISSQVTHFLHTLITMYYFDHQNIRKARNHMHKNKVLYEEQMGNLLNVNSNATLPEELHFKNLQSHILPYIKAVVDSLGKPRFFKVISIIQKRSEETDTRRALIDKIISDCVTDGSVNSDGEETSVNALPQCDAVEINCNKVSSNNDMKTNINQPSIAINTTFHTTTPVLTDSSGGDKQAHSCKISLLQHDNITPTKSTIQEAHNNNPITVSKVTSKSPLEVDFHRIIPSQDDDKCGSSICKDHNVELRTGRRNMTSNKHLFTKSNTHASASNTLTSKRTRNKRKHVELKDLNLSCKNVDTSGESLDWTSDDENVMPFQMKSYPIRHKGKTSMHKKNAKKVKFSENEENFVIEGVDEYGVGNWKEILQAYPFHKSRTNISIKDKYRTLLKNGLIQGE